MAENGKKVFGTNEKNVLRKKKDENFSKERLKVSNDNYEDDEEMEAADRHVFDSDDDWMRDIEFKSECVKNFNTAVNDCILNLCSKNVRLFFLETRSVFYKSQFPKFLEKALLENKKLGKYCLVQVKDSDCLIEENFWDNLSSDICDKLNKSSKETKICLYINNIDQRLDDKMTLKDFIDYIEDLKSELELQEIKIVATIDSDNSVIGELGIYPGKRYQYSVFDLKEEDFEFANKVFDKSIFKFFYKDVKITTEIFEYFFNHFVIVHDEKECSIDIFLREVDIIATYCYLNNIKTITKSVIREVYSMEFPALYSQSFVPDYHLTSIHEIGHLLTAIYLYGDNYIPVIVSNLPGGDESMGCTRYKFKCVSGSKTKKDIKNDLIYSLGCISANNVVGEKNDTGIEKDLEEATEMVKDLIMQLGFDKKFGMNYNTDYSKLSNKQKQIVDKEINKYLKKAVKKGEKIIKSNLDVFNELIKALDEKNILTTNDIKKIVNHKLNKIEDYKL